MLQYEANIPAAMRRRIAKTSHKSCLEFCGVASWFVDELLYFRRGRKESDHNVLLC